MSLPRIYDGLAVAAALEQALLERVQAKTLPGQKIVLAAVLFQEDRGSVIYTRLKQEAAERIGIEYQAYEVSLHDPVEEVIALLTSLNQDPTVTGIIIQKPSKQLWVAEQTKTNPQAGKSFHEWWLSLVTQLSLTKDVDGLHPMTLAAIKAGTWQAQGLMMPATARAIVWILEAEKLLTPTSKIVMIGRSDIVGQPIYYHLLDQKYDVEMIGSVDLIDRKEQKMYLKDADVVISATGRPHLLSGEWFKPGVAVIDVGEPKPDVDATSLAGVAAFVTPVPGGVGPLTVQFLLQNAVELATRCGILQP